MKNSQGNAIVWILLIAVGVFVFSMFVIFSQGILTPSSTPEPIPTPEPKAERIAMELFASCDALAETIGDARAKSSRYFAEDIAIAAPQLLFAPTTTAVKSEIGSGGNQDYTKTNVQVEDVDEADIVKTDGEYLYTLSGGAINIIDVSPAGEASVVGTIDFANNSAQNFFISKNKLVVFGSRYIEIDRSELGQGSESVSGAGSISPSDESAGTVLPSIIASDIYPWSGYGKQVAFAEIYDISDRSTPILVRTVEFEGNFLSSRLIKEDVYVVVQSWPNYYPLVEEGGAQVLPTAEKLIPGFREGGAGELVPSVECDDVARAIPSVESNYMTVASFPMEDIGADVKREVILGAGSTVYASTESLYIAGTSYTGGKIIDPPPQLVPFIGRPIEQEYESLKEETIIHAFTLNNGSVKYRGNGRVPGHILNQFSLDEFNGTFRITTTKGQVSRNERKNAGPISGLYLLDAKSFERLGAIEGIAPGETIYSARFMGERAYLVTFKKVDPFFVFDLSDPANPKTLGKLKIPGYSDYLHPFNSEGTMIIGVGKNAEEAAEGNFAWYQGMKLALFDATDPENPAELFKVDIGDRGTNSLALNDHKAFLFDASRNLLVLPITLAETSDEVKENALRRGSEYGSFTFQGAYVYELTVEDGFRLLARVTHFDDSDEYFKKTGFYSGYSNLFVRRNVRIDDVLWSISDGKIIASDLNDDELVTIAEVELSSGELSEPRLEDFRAL